LPLEVSFVAPPFQYHLGLYWALRGALAGDHVAFPPPLSLPSTRRCGVWWSVPFLSVINAYFSLFSVVFSVFLGSFQLASVLLFPLLDFTFFSARSTLFREVFATLCLLF
jgi:hypothetical protein